MTLDRVSTAGGYPLTRIDCINATACCHSSACGRVDGVKKHEGQRGGHKSKRTVSEVSYEQEPSCSSLYTAWPSVGVWTRHPTGQGRQSREYWALQHLGAILRNRKRFKSDARSKQSKATLQSSRGRADKSYCCSPTSSTAARRRRYCCFNNSMRTGLCLDPDA